MMDPKKRTEENPQIKRLLMFANNIVVAEKLTDEKSSNGLF